MDVFRQSHTRGRNVQPAVPARPFAMCTVPRWPVTIIWLTCRRWCDRLQP